jgi:hypothetical protein
MPTSRRTEQGFSHVELMVAMVVTLIIAGAIFGMMQVGQNAFRREPELVDRQDNIRMAMNLIERDLAGAGMGMGKWYQVFTPALDGVSTVVGPGGTLGGANTLSSNGHFNGSAAQTQAPDFLEFISKSPDCPDVKVSCPSPTGIQPCSAGVNLLLTAPLPSCYPSDFMVYVVWDTGGGKFGVAHNDSSAGGGAVNFPSGSMPSPCTDDDPPMICQGSQDFRGDLPAPWDGLPERIMILSMVRYEIANDADGTPCLFRSEFGGRGPAGVGARTSPPGGTWQLVARGIEDMQVVYTTLAADGVV